MKLTLSEAKSTIARVLGVCTTSSKVADYINEATRRLLYEGKFVGTYAKYRLCTNGNESDSIITWPRFIESIETFAVCDKPGVIRNEWYEFLETGPWVLDKDNSIGTQLVDRGEACTISDVLTTGNSKKIKVKSDVAESASAKIFLQGYDWSGNRIRTLSNGSYVDGEYVTISAAGTLSTNTFSKLDTVQKPVTSGFVRLYEYDTSTAAERQIALYEAGETLPWYRRSIIPGLQNMSTCTDCSSGQMVEVRAKLRFIPVVNDTDFILIGNPPALKLAVMAIKKEEDDLLAEAMAYMYGGRLPDGRMAMGAVPLLQKELQHWLGDGAVPVMRVQHPATFGASGVENPV